jgi:alpha-ketoglutarate-dependent taurine dioxygenase
MTMNYKSRKNEPFGVIVEPRCENSSVLDLNVDHLKNLFRAEHLIVLRGFTPFSQPEHFATWCELFGEISIWPFGKVLNLEEQAYPEDHIFDSSYVPLHWDGMYRPQVPEYQIFQCVKAPISGLGGRTTFSNTIDVLRNASPDLLEFWGKATGIYERKMEFYDSRTISPIITKHPFRDEKVVRYNEPHQEKNGRFVNPPNISFSGLSEEDSVRLHQTLQAALYSPQNFFAHEWEEGDIVIADNFSLLHGREAFVSNSPRQLWRVQVLSTPAYNNPSLERHQ